MSNKIAASSPVALLLNTMPRTYLCVCIFLFLMSALGNVQSGSWESKLDEGLLEWLSNATQKSEERKVAIHFMPDALDEIPLDQRR